MSINYEIQRFIAVYGQDMDNREKDLVQEIFDRFADAPKKQERMLDLFHSFVANGYQDGFDDAKKEGDDYYTPEDQVPDSFDPPDHDLP